MVKNYLSIKENYVKYLIMAYCQNYYVDNKFTDYVSLVNLVNSIIYEIFLVAQDESVEIDEIEEIIDSITHELK